jgi:hypothetical protein
LPLLARSLKLFEARLGFGSFLGDQRRIVAIRVLDDVS